MASDGPPTLETYSPEQKRTGWLATLCLTPTDPPHLTLTHLPHVQFVTTELTSWSGTRGAKLWVTLSATGLMTADIALV